MNIYARYASGEHDKAHFDERAPTANSITLRPLSGQFDMRPDAPSDTYSVAFWRSVFPSAAFFAGHDPVLFGQVITMLYKNDHTHKICALSITKYGSNVFNNIVLDASSRFWPACDNLLAKHRGSNVRKALAIVNLKNYNKLWNNRGCHDFSQPWDETNAGSLASSMVLINSTAPAALGEKILSYGFLQESRISSMVVDVVYDNMSSPPQTVEENNSLVSLLGTQMLQLFDPLLEYSPQAVDFQYMPPQDAAPLFLQNNFIVDKVLEELVNVQTNFTMDLVNVLQDLIIPLRAHILTKVSKSTLGVTKVNMVFPPTIDEITRVNCILNNSLKLAHGYGYREVFKVLASFIPFFYKAFARHQASIAKFHSNFKKFLKHNKTYAFDNPDINKGSYTPKRVENIITGSIYELSKLKLIVQRLYDVVLSESLQTANFDAKDNAEIADITLQYNSILESINSLGYGDGIDEEPAKTRVFTPTGKLLTELATEWPSELQYGWLTRKVLAVYELQSIDSEPDAKLDVLIIFSDHLLFLEVTGSKNDRMSLRLPDVLMNSLINQKPLPKLSAFPKLKVKYWCDIKQVVLRSYSTGEGQCLNFFTYGNNSFQSRSVAGPIKSLCYKIPSEQDAASACRNIMDHVCRARILCKASPFHLFKTEDGGLNRFYCAQEESDFSHEVSKSLVAILLNMNMEKAAEVFEYNSEISLVINLSYLNQHSVHISGYSRDRVFEVDEHVSVDELTNSLRDVFATFMEGLFHSSSFTESLVETNSITIKSLLNEKPDEETAAGDKAQNRTSTDFDNFWKYPEVSEPERTPKEVQPQEPRVETQSTSSSNFVSNFFRKLTGKSGSRHKSQARQKPSQKAQKNIDNTGIPRGKKVAYNKLYKPSPVLDEGSTVISEASEKAAETEAETGAPATQILPKKTEQKRMVSTNTGSSSRYSSGSVDANSHFRFPLGHSLGDIDEDPSENKWLYPENKPASSTPIASPQGNSRASVELKDPQPVATQQPSKNPVFKPVQEIKKYSHLPATPGNETRANVRKAPDSLPVQKRTVKSMLGDKPTRIAPIPENTEKNFAKSDEHNSDANCKAFESMNATGVSPEVYAKYKMYEDIPSSVISGSGGANWTALARDSSSNLHEELRAMEAEVEKKRLGSGLSAVVMIPQVQQFDTSDDTFSTFEMVTVDHGQASQPAQNRIASAETIRAKPSTDVESEPSLDTVDQFGLELDNYFSLSPSTLVPTEAAFSQFDTGKMASEENVPKPHMDVGLHTASSEDEFFSSHEFNDTVELMARECSENSEASSTSEKTLMNDFALAEYYVELEDEAHVARPEPVKVVKQTHVNLVEGDHLGRFESMAYLSDILNGNVVF